MDLKEIEAEIRIKHPGFATTIDRWRGGSQSSILAGEERGLIWDFVSAAYDLGFTKGMTHGLEQHAKIMNFAMGKILGKI